MKHVAPHRWADAFAGHLGEDEVAQMERHADACRACARARDRVQRASQSFPSLRVEVPPELAWDSVRARVHWSLSSARRARSATRSRGAAFLAWGALAAGGVALALLSGTIAPPPVSRTASPAPAVAHAAPRPEAPPAPLAVTGIVNRLAGEVMVDGIRRVDAFDRPITAGTVLATAGGRIDVQFGPASAFSLGPHSSLELHRFDREAIELAVDGTVDIVVAPRAPGQRFLVRAGDRTVEVRGTQFRVTHDHGATTVACRHGLVAVRDGAGEVDVAAARRVELSPGQAVGESHPVALDAAALADLAQSTPVTIAAATDVLSHSSSALEIATAGRREVRVDGVELGAAPLRVRVMPGRHTVEAADAAGRFRRAGWVDVAAVQPAKLEVPAEAPPTTGIVQRKRQLHAGIDRARLSRCVRAIAKAGLTGTYVQVEISVDGAGAVNFLNVIDTDLPSATASCVREVLADVRFGAGPTATWREKIDL